MAPRKAKSKKLFVLDTNVLMHDPNAIHRFGRHDIYLPMIVLEELDAHKKGMAETARNVRQVSRIMDGLLKGRKGKEISSGIPLQDTINADGDAKNPGSLFLQTESVDVALPDSLVTGKADNSILASALHLKTTEDRPVVLVSKDINLRIKAAALGLDAEDYIHDAHEIDDLALLYSGAVSLSDEDFVAFTDAVDADDGDKAVELLREVAPKNDIYANQCVWHDATGAQQPSRKEYILKADENSRDNRLILDKITNYRREGNAAWGIAARNRAQNFAMNMLMDPNIDIVTLCGAAGTGKTLLALAAGLAQTFDPRPGQQQPFTEIIMTRVTVPLGEDIGFLPGTEEEKMTPWMGALMDNLEVLGTQDQQGNTSSWASGASQDFLMNKIKIRSLNFMRGRTFFNRYVIIDEAQNLTPKQMKALITRVGPNSKIVCMGNLAQIDTPYLTETTSGLTYVVERFKNWSHAGHVTLTQGERSRLADYASENL